MHRYRIFPRGRKEYLLEGEGVLLGTLSLRGIHRHKAVITIGTSKIELTRKAAFRKHVHLLRGQEEIHFAATNASKGSLTLDGIRYNWIPQNIRWTSWAWQTDNRSSITLHMNDSFLRAQGSVQSGDALASEDDILLTLFGWYLLLLNHQNFGRHILHALSFAVGKH